MDITLTGVAPTSAASLAEIEELLAARRSALARTAAKIYSECRSLRKAAAQLGISHEQVRYLVREARDHGG